MPINAFGGGPGSGKTYGVMEHVILPAIAQGRFILTNIEGLNPDLIYNYVAAEAPKGKIICIGHIRTCDRSAPDDEDFFPGEAALDKPMPVPSPELGRVCGGDLVVIDEATRYWVQGERVKSSHAYFFREHRHFANEMGHTCDLLVIDPDLSLLARPLKGKIEMSSVTHKPKEIGVNRYVVRIYRGCKLTGKPTQILGPYSFKEKIYSLYKSYSHDKAKEQSIDGRQNVLKNPRLWALLVAILIMGSLSLWGVLHFLGSAGKVAELEAQQPGALPPKTAGGAGAAPPAASGVSAKSEALRIAGEVVINGERWVVVADAAGRQRLENPAAFIGRGVFLVGTVEGRRVTTWTGGTSPAANVPGVGLK